MTRTMTVEETTMTVVAIVTGMTGRTMEGKGTMTMMDMMIIVPNGGTRFILLFAPTDL